ncbi:hypothetical protein SB861_16415 [Paraburkholderia sp. SIMBA_049]
MNKESRNAGFKALATALVTESRREVGCLARDLWRSAEAHEYAFIECYIDEAVAGGAAALMSSFS